jgi:hypothetical protein
MRNPASGRGSPPSRRSVCGCVRGGWLFAALWLVACGSRSAASAGRPPEVPAAVAPVSAELPRFEAMADYASEGDESEEALPASPPPQPSSLQTVSLETSASGESAAAGAPLQAATPASPQPPRPPEALVDAAHSGPLLIYMAAFQLHVYEVEKAQTELKAAAKRLGGFVSEQTDASMTLRIPSARFEEAIVAVESSGKVRARHVQALDVGDQYRDLSVRLRTAEALRDRLEAMLARAAKVEEALQVEKELERIVREIEVLKGQLRAMGDRIALSTIRVDFRPEARPELDGSDAFRLPYAWLEELGLHQLLELTP